MCDANLVAALSQKLFDDFVQYSALLQYLYFLANRSTNIFPIQTKICYNRNIANKTSVLLKFIVLNFARYFRDIDITF